jgi:hypothetical protein
MDLPFNFEIATNLPIAGTVSSSPESFLDVLQSAKQELREKSELLVLFKEELENLKTEKQHVSLIILTYRGKTVEFGLVWGSCLKDLMRRF